VSKLLNSIGIDGEIDLKLRCSNDHLSEFVTEKLSDNINSFTSRTAASVSNISIGLDLRKTNVKIKGVPEYECRINMFSDQGNFYASEVKIGAVSAVSGCLSNIEYQIEKKKGKYVSRMKTREKDNYSFIEET